MWKRWTKWKTSRRGTCPPVSATEVVVPIVGEETLDGCHMADVKPPSPAVAFHVVARNPPPLALLAPGFPLSAPMAPDVAETVDHVGVIPEPNGHKMSVPPPLAPSLAIDSADRREEQKQNKMEAKLKKPNDRDLLIRLFWVSS